MQPLGLGVLSSALILAGVASAAPLNIVLEPLFEPDERQQLFLNDAKNFWEYFIPAYSPGIVIDALTIEVGGYQIDGPGNVIAQADVLHVTKQAGYTLPTYGFVDFDLDDLATQIETGMVFATLLHEVAHVLGFGGLWQENGVYAQGSGLYTGMAGLAEYRSEFDRFATGIPVELEFGAGTAEFHWSEGWAGGPTELMTGLEDPDPYLSRTTVASFADLGYTPSLVPVPLPAGIWLGFTAFGLLSGIARPRRERDARAPHL